MRAYTHVLYYYSYGASASLLVEPRYDACQCRRTMCGPLRAEREKVGRREARAPEAHTSVDYMVPRTICIN